MADFLNFLFYPLSNGIMTVLAGLTALYWIFTFVAGDFLGEFDAGVDVDAEIDGDITTEGGDGAPEKSWWGKTLEYVNVGKVPFMVVYSTFKFIAWIFTLVSSLFLDMTGWGWKSVLILIPVFIVTYYITRLATKPFIKVYHVMGYNGEEKYDLIGRTAKMRSTISGNKIGSAELVINKDVIRINVQSKSGELLSYNTDVMIADESINKRYFYVVPEVTLNNVV